MKRKQKNLFFRAPFSWLPFFVICLFLSVFFVLPAQAAIINNYNKAADSTLAASEWNTLLTDFVAKNNGGDVLTGYFGINTATSSTYALDINGALRATSFSGVYTGNLYASNIFNGAFGSNTGNGDYGFPNRLSLNFGAGTTPLTLSQPASTTLAINGRVGVGTTSANALLHLYQNGGNNAELDIQSVAGALQHWAIYQERTNGDLRFWNNNISGEKNLFTLTDNGSVGIGIINPYAKLDIFGALKFGDTADACDANHSGALRYNSTSGQSYLCDGKRWLNQKNCGLMTDDAGETYGTVQIGGQCWMAENINIGTMLAAGTTEPNTSDNVIEKWCYSNSTGNCDLYGGLYNWNEAMRGSSVSGARGICPAGWHIPTDAEYNQLEKTVLGIIASPNPQYVCDFNTVNTNWYWRRCADDNGGDSGGVYGAGKSLKAIGQGSGNGAGNDLAGFNGKLSGYRNTGGSFNYLTSSLYLWSSTPNGASNAWYRVLVSSYSTVYRLNNSRAYGFSVRCLQD